MGLDNGQYQFTESIRIQCVRVRTDGVESMYVYVFCCVALCSVLLIDLLHEQLNGIHV